MRKSLAMISGGLILASSLVMASGAYALSLTNWNTTELQASGDSVDIVVSGNSVIVTFNDAAGTPDPDYKSMLTIGWNGLTTGSLVSITPNGGDPNLNPDYALRTSGQGAPYQLDGFGNFSTVYDLRTPVGSYTYPTSYTFTFQSLSGSLSTAAVHVQYNGNCSGWVGNGTSSSSESATGCGGTSVPEPASLMLLGAGLAGLGIWRRKQA